MEAGFVDRGSPRKPGIGFTPGLSIVGSKARSNVGPRAKQCRSKATLGRGLRFIYCSELNHSPKIIYRKYAIIN